MGQISHGQGVVIGEFPAGAHLLGHASEGKEVKVKDENDVRPDTRNKIAHVVIEATPNRRHADHHGNTNDDTEHGKPGSQLVAADGIRRHVNDLAEFRFSDHK